MYDLSFFGPLRIYIDFINEYTTQEVENQIKTQQEYLFDLTAGAGQLQKILFNPGL